MNHSTSKWQIQEFLGLAKLAAGLCLLVLLLSTLSSAQSTGTVTGTVADQSGAVVAKAKITLKNEATGDTRETTSNESGYFSFGTVNPGTYAVKVSAANFKSLERKGLSVLPGDVRDVRDLALQVGTSSDVIEVTGVADEVAPVDSGERSSVLTSKQIENLSLEGREGGAVGQGYVGNGAPYRGGTDIISDGAHILDTGCNCGATQTVNGDMVSEVKVQTSNFGADSAKGPIVVNAVGKSGSTSYHGEFTLHARDGSLNSDDWAFRHQQLTSPAGLVPNPSGRFLYPGAQFGGAVPGTNKKLVFFVGYEYYYQHGFPFTTNINIPGLLTDVVPTQSMRVGDFSSTGGATPASAAFGADNAALCGSSAGGNSGQVFCQNLGNSLSWWNQAGTTQTSGGTGIIPSTQIDPGGAVFMANFPQPNADPSKTGGFNYLQSENLNQNAYTLHPRVDYNLSDNSKLYVTYNVQKETDNSPVHLWWTPPNSIPYPGGMTSKDNSQTLSGHFLHVFNPTLTNEVTSGLGYVNYPLQRNNKNAWGATTAGYPYKTVFGNPTSGTYGPTNSYMMPAISNGYWVAGVPFMDQQDIWENGGGTFTWKKWNFSLEDNVTKSFKTHTIKAGFYYERTQDDQGAFTPLQGEFGFRPFASNSCDDGQKLPTSVIKCGSNNPVADMILGTASNGFSQVNRAALDSLWYPTVSGFVQDDWKVNRRLTLNLGLRADHLGGWTPLTSAGVATWTGNLSTAGPNSLTPGITWHGFDSKIPLTGRNVDFITWQPRLGLALDLRGNGKTVLRGGWGEYGYRDQWNDYAGPVDLAQGVISYNSPGAIKFSQVSGLNGSPQTLSGTASAVTLHDHKQPVSRSYNFTVSQQTPWSTLFEIGYVGSSTINDVFRPNGLWNINFVPFGALFTAQGCSAPCNTNPSFQPAYAIGGTASGAAYGTNPINLVQHIAKSNYNGLQASWARQRGRISYNLNYTWSKTLGTQGEGGGAGSGLQVDSTGIAHNYGVLGTDRSHLLNLSYAFQTGNPIRANKVLGAAANGWNISGITTWQSGGNLQELSNQDFGLGVNGNIYNPNNSFGNTPGTAFGVATNTWLGSGSVSLQPTVTCNPTANLKAHQYVNMNCFGMPAPGTNGAYQLPYIHGPAYFNSDLALFKTFKMTERQSMEFRVSAFNFLNHPLDSFQNNGDLKLNFNATEPSPGVYNFVNTTTAPASGVSTLGNSTTFPGYASTRFGRRVMEFSLNYKF